MKDKLDSYFYQKYEIHEMCTISRISLVPIIFDLRSVTFQTEADCMNFIFQVSGWCICLVEIHRRWLTMLGASGGLCTSHEYSYGLKDCNNSPCETPFKKDLQERWHCSSFNPSRTRTNTYTKKNINKSKDIRVSYSLRTYSHKPFR